MHNRLKISVLHGRGVSTLNDGLPDQYHHVYPIVLTMKTCRMQQRRDKNKIVPQLFPIKAHCIVMEKETNQAFHLFLLQNR